MGGGSSFNRKRRRDIMDVYQAEDPDPTEERQAGRQFDSLGPTPYEMGSDFEGSDEEIDEETAFTAKDKSQYGGWFPEDADAGFSDEDAGAGDLSAEEHEASDGASDEAADSEAESESDGERHQQVLAEVTGRQAGRQRQQKQKLVTEAYPESEANLPPVQNGSGNDLTVADMMRALGKDGAKLGKVGKQLAKLAKAAAPVGPALPGPIQARQRRRAGYEATTEEVSKWQDLVKANREAPTLDLAKLQQRGGPQAPSTIASMTAGFKPQSEMEKDIEAMLLAAQAAAGDKSEEAEENDLVGKALTVEEVRARQQALARMRSLLLRHADKARHLKKIKSKDFHRRTIRAAKAKAKKAGEAEGDEEGYLRLAAEQAELERAKERLTLRHKNSSRWARRALKRGVNVMDEGTREALDEQLRIGQELRRKVERVEEPGSSGDDSDDGTDASDQDDGDKPAETTGGRDKLSQRAAKRMRTGALDILQGQDAEAPSKGLLALPFMRRALERQKATAQADAAEVLRELDRQDAGPDGDDETGDGVGEDDEQAWGSGRMVFGGTIQPATQQAQPAADSGESSDEFEDAEARIARVTQDTQPPAAALPQSKATARAAAAGVHVDEADGLEDGQSMQPVKGQGMTQRELIAAAFAGDDVQAQFDADKAAEAEAEAPPVEEPSQLPGWGNWADRQREPAWLLSAKAQAQKKREEALQARKDANMKGVVISERWDKKASKYGTPSLPFPFKSRDAYERQMRQPMGSDYNTSLSHRNFIRPAVLKDTGVIIQPIKFTKQGWQLRSDSGRLATYPGIGRAHG
ncbi:hypothetical protein WJX73_003829 [Symbiochloris irregularis]|uniref:U3 small nucleolar RNA-associated protein 14 n=1 Tax=Symbiochloris irregularis TaxID=706552 RepID=A0AAW1PU54_9CHLO